MGSVADYHQQCSSVPDDCAAFVWLVTDAAIMGEHDPAAPADLREPHFVGRFRSKVILVSLYREPSRPQNPGETVAEVAIREIDKRQAARS